MSWMIWHEITFLFLFVIWKSLQVLQKVRMKIMTCFLHLATFSYTYSPLWLEKRWCDRYFPYQLRPQITVQSYILQDYSSVRISFNMNNKCHILPIVQGFPKSVKDWGKFHTSGGEGTGNPAGGHFCIRWWEPEERFWPFKPFSMLKTTFCKYWKSITIKISETLHVQRAWS